MSKPMHYQNSAVPSEEWIDAMPPYTVPVRGRDITFVQVSDMQAGLCGGPDGAWAFLHLCTPEKSDVGLFASMSAGKARELAHGLLSLADQLDRGGVRQQ